MFGYIVVNRPELKIKEYDRYHAYYCGVCRDLRGSYGLKGQITLSYDLTFLAILLTSLYEPPRNMSRVRCLSRPQAHPALRNDYTAYAADMNLLMAYYKAMDDWSDDRRPDRLAFAASLRGSIRNIEHKYPKKCSFIKKRLEEITALERDNCEDPDLISAKFGKIMSALFHYKSDAWTRPLDDLGFYLGKYIYLLDAYDDIESDVKKGNYNPLLNIRNNDKLHFDETCEILLRQTISSCALAFEHLPLIRDAELLRNILYSGVWTRYNEVKKRRAENKT